MPYGPETIAELPYKAIIASFVLGLVWAAAATGAEPNISEPAGAAVCDGAAGEVVLDRKSAKGSAPACCDGGDMSAIHHTHTSAGYVLPKVTGKLLQQA